MPCIKKKKLESQLRITYTLLYHLGLRLNEIRTLKFKTFYKVLKDRN
jgi:hypothetical protein